MAISRVGTDGGGHSTTTTLSMTYPTGIAAGDLILVGVGGHPSTTITTPSGYSLADSYNSGDGSGAAGICYVYGKYAAGTESGTLSITVGGSVTRSGGIILALHGNAGGFSSTVANNFSAFQHDHPAQQLQASTTTALTGVPSGAWLVALDACASHSGTPTCAITGTNWSEESVGEQDAAAAGSTAALDMASNTTDTGTANACTFTWSANTYHSTISFYVKEQAGASFVLNPLFGPLGRTRFVG